MYSFADVLARHLSDLVLSKITRPPIPSSKKNGKNEAQSHEIQLTFEQLMQQHEHVAFLLTSQGLPTHGTVVDQLKKVLHKLNSTSPESIGSNESIVSGNGVKRKGSGKFSRLFGGKKKDSPSSLRKFLFGSQQNKQTTEKNGNEEPPGSPTSPAGSSSRDQLAVILLSLDANMQSYYQTVNDCEGCWLFPADALTQRTHVLRVCGVQQSTGPALVLIDSTTKSVVNTDGRRALADDPEAVHFPWYPLQPSDVFKGEIVSPSTSQTADLETFKPAVRGLLFAANWCPPCRSFVRQLIAVYSNVRANGHNFEIIFCSSDRSEESYSQFISYMPWYVLPYNDERVRQLTRVYNVHGIPSLILIDADNQLITRHGKDSVCGDMKGRDFPWGRRSIYELTEHTLCRIKDEPTLIIFTDGSDEDISFSLALLRSVVSGVGGVTPTTAMTSSSRLSAIIENDENGNNSGNTPEQSPDKSNLNDSLMSQNSMTSQQRAARPPKPVLQCMYTGADVICDQMLTSLGFDADCELPVAVIVDVLGGQLYVSQDSAVSVPIVSKFMRDFMADNLTATRQIDCALSAAHRSANRSSVVGGIPLDAVNQVLAERQAQANTINTTNNATSVDAV